MKSSMMIRQPDNSYVEIESGDLVRRLLYDKKENVCIFLGKAKHQFFNGTERVEVLTSDGEILGLFSHAIQKIGTDNEND